MASKFLLALSLSLLVSAAFGERIGVQLSREQQCRIERFSAVQPARRIQSELWDEMQSQFQCAGVVPMRNTLSPNALSLPKYHATPPSFTSKEGFVGIDFPGCAETYTGEATEEKQRGRMRELHQKVHRVRAGDIVAIPASAVHWCYNDGREELVAVSINPISSTKNSEYTSWLAGCQETNNNNRHFTTFSSRWMRTLLNI